MKLTKSKLKQIIKEHWEPPPVDSVALDDLLRALFNARTQAKDLQQWDVAGHIDEAINLLEISISSGPR